MGIKVIARMISESQGMEMEEALEYAKELRKAVLEDGEDPEELLYEEGIEPDYILDLIGM